MKKENTLVITLINPATMHKIGDVPEIHKINSQLDELRQKGIVLDWEIPCMEMLTRKSAALYFITAVSEEAEPLIWETLKIHDGFGYRMNDLTDISHLKWCVTFNNDPIKNNS